MTDETQTPAAAAAAPEAAPAAVTPPAAPVPDDGFSVEDGNTHEVTGFTAEGKTPEVEPTAEEKAAEAAKLPDWAAERVARAKRQRDEERGKVEYLGKSLDELRDVVKKLKGLDPENFPTHEAYEAAKKDLNGRAEQLTAPEAPADPRQAALAQAATDLRYEVSRDDPDLWAQVIAVEEVDGQKLPKVNNLTAEMIEALADADDSTGKLRALVAMSDEDRLEIAELSPRMQRKAIMRLAPVAKGGKAAAEPAPAAVERDPATGQFTRRVSEAPPPIEPVAGNGSGTPPLSGLARGNDAGSFIARRNEEAARAARFDW